MNTQELLILIALVGIFFLFLVVLDMLLNPPTIHKCPKCGYTFNQDEEEA